MKYADPMTAELSVHHAIHEGRAYFVGAYFIMVDVGSDWYSPHTYLIEQIILWVPGIDNEVRWPDLPEIAPRKATLNDAIASLDGLAAKYKASAIAVGDTQHGMMLPSYQDHGYRVMGHQLFKEVPYGVRTEDHGGAGAD
jgi:hypothetical protein